MTPYTSRPRQRRIELEPNNPRPWELPALVVGLLLGALLIGFCAPTSAHGQQTGTRYSPPTNVHWCVDPDPATQQFTPGKIDFSQVPKSATDGSWPARRYRTADGQRNPGAMRGTTGLHTPDYTTALEELGYVADVVSTRDAYCTRDTEVLSRAQAVRIAGDESTPFSPGVWSWGRRNWDVSSWETFLQYNARAIRMNMGQQADFFVAVVRYQLAQALEACTQGTGPASDPSAGDWRLNRAGKCKPEAWTRPGKLEPYWARPVRIDMGTPEFPAASLDFVPSRRSTGDLATSIDLR